MESTILQTALSLIRCPSHTASPEAGCSVHFLICSFSYSGSPLLPLSPPSSFVLLPDLILYLGQPPIFPVTLKFLLPIPLPSNLTNKSSCNPLCNLSMITLISLSPVVSKITFKSQH